MGNYIISIFNTKPYSHIVINKKKHLISLFSLLLYAGYSELEEDDDVGDGNADHARDQRPVNTAQRLRLSQSFLNYIKGGEFAMGWDKCGGQVWS